MQRKITTTSIKEFQKHLEEQGLKPRYVTTYIGNLRSLTKWEGLNGQPLTTNLLEEWKEHLETRQLSKTTIGNYVKTVNRYLKFMGWEDLCFKRGRSYDLTGKTFGYLTVISKTGQKKYKNNLWHCQCKCGREIDVPTAQLTKGNTTSCGCLKTEILQRANKNIDGTSIRQSMDDTVISKHAVSGYVGIQPKRGKWLATLQYKGTVYRLGVYEDIEDAIEARRKAKEKVMEDAAYLECIYDELHKDEPLPGRPKTKKHKIKHTTEEQNERKREDINRS